MLVAKVAEPTQAFLEFEAAELAPVMAKPEQPAEPEVGPTPEEWIQRVEDGNARKESLNPKGDVIKQYDSIKAKYPETILFFRLGDFYETFGADAITTSKVTGIILTSRTGKDGSTIALAGFPHHQLDSYLPKMIRAGFRVAVCEQQGK